MGLSLIGFGKWGKMLDCFFERGICPFSPFFFNFLFIIIIIIIIIMETIELSWEEKSDIC